MTALPDLLPLDLAVEKLGRKGLKVTVRTLREAVRHGTLPASKIGREMAVTLADLAHYATVATRIAPCPAPTLASASSGPSAPKGPGHLSISSDGSKADPSASAQRGTGDLETAEGKLQEFIEERRRAVAAPEAIQPRDPHEVLMTEILDICGTEVAPNLGDADRVAYAIDALRPARCGTLRRPGWRMLGCPAARLPASWA